MGELDTVKPAAEGLGAGCLELAANPCFHSWYAGWLLQLTVTLAVSVVPALFLPGPTQAAKKLSLRSQSTTEDLMSADRVMVAA